MLPGVFVESLCALAGPKGRCRRRRGSRPAPGDRYRGCDATPRTTESPVRSPTDPVPTELGCGVERLREIKRIVELLPFPFRTEGAFFLFLFRGIESVVLVRVEMTAETQKFINEGVIQLCRMNFIIFEHI